VDSEKSQSEADLILIAFHSITFFPTTFTLMRKEESTATKEVLFSHKPLSQMEFFCFMPNEW
jgi:hypothetical protein